MDAVSLILLATRVVVFAAFAFAAVVAGTHWAVTRGHLTPFSAPARAVRRLGEPVVRPMERALLGRGGNPANAPFALFWVALIGGLALLALVQWLLGFALSLTASAASGPRGVVGFLVYVLFTVLKGALWVRVLSSWFSISRYSRPMRIVYGLTDWLVEPLRRVLPPLGMFDLSPFVAYLMLVLAQSFLSSVI